MKLSFVLFSQAANGSAGKLPRLRLYRHGRVLAGAAGGATRFQDYPLQIATNAQRLVSGFTYTLLLTIPSSLYADWILASIKNEELTECLSVVRPPPLFRRTL